MRFILVKNESLRQAAKIKFEFKVAIEDEFINWDSVVVVKFGGIPLYIFPDVVTINL